MGYIHFLGWGAARWYVFLTLSLFLDIVLALLIPMVYLAFAWSDCGRVSGPVDSVSFVWGGCQVLFVPLGV